MSLLPYFDNDFSKLKGKPNSNQSQNSWEQKKTLSLNRTSTRIKENKQNKNKKDKHLRILSNTTNQSVVCVRERDRERFF